MFEQGLVKVGDNYIAPASGFFFCHIEEESYKEPDKLQAQIDAATTEVFPLSEPFIFQDHYRCILFGAKGVPLIPVQIAYLEVVGVRLDEVDRYIFKVDKNLKTPSLMVYGPGLLGGVMPMGATREGWTDDTATDS